MIYAIDFGTSNSLLGAASATQTFAPIPLDPTASDPSVFRSLMYFAPQEQPCFGEEAIKAYVENSMNGRFLKSFKRFLPLESFESTVINGRIWKLEELVARFLREMRERANAHFNQDVTSVVLGRPAAFSEDAAADRLAHNRLETAAQLAGFTSIEFLPEPIAAAYRFRKEIHHEEMVLVADFGGGTSDYTILKLSQKEFKPEDVVAVHGAPVAGDALDGALMRHRVAKHFGSEVRYRVPMSSNVLTMPKGMSSYLYSTAYINFLNSPEHRDFLRKVERWSLGAADDQRMQQLAVLLENQLGFSIFEAIEGGKRRLSDSESTHIKFAYPGIVVDEPVSRDNFRQDTSDEIGTIFGALDETLARAGLRADQIDRVCCTGGTAKALMVREQLAQRFAADKLESFRHFSSIAEGLGERAQQLQR